MKKEEEMKKEDVDRIHSRLIRSFTQDHIQTYQIQSRRTSANHSLKTLLYIYKQQKQEIHGLHQEISDTKQQQKIDQEINKGINDIEEIEQGVQNRSSSEIKTENDEKISHRALQNNK